MNISIKSSNNEEAIFNITGENAIPSTINAIRRTILREIPIYGLPTSNIFIEKNTSIYDNDQLRIRFGNIPLQNYSNKLTYIDNSISNIESENKIEMYLNVINNTKSNLNVTTNDLTFVINDEQVNNLYDTKRPHLFLKLKPEQEIKFRSVPCIGKASMNDIWSCGHCYYSEKKENMYEFVIETLGQLTCKEILSKSCDIIIEKLKIIEINIGDNYKDSKINDHNKIQIILHNEEHTMGNLITTALQLHTNTIYAGYKKDHPLINEIVINLETSSTNPLNTFFSVISDLKKLYGKLKTDVEKLQF
jgi:DNA-directed RNA polymerase subunit L